MSVDPATLQKLGELAMRLAGNPQTRPDFLKQMAKVDPSYRLPADVQFEDFKAQFKKEQEEKEIRTKAEQAQRNARNQRNKLINSGKYTEDQVKEIETGVMKKYGLNDYEAAAKVYAADIAPSKPSNRDKMRHGQIWEFPNLPGLLNNPEKAASDAAYAIIDEFRAGR